MACESCSVDEKSRALDGRLRIDEHPCSPMVVVCYLSSFSAFLPISLARETGDADPCPVMYITAWGTVFFYACSAHTGQAIGIGGGASHAMPEEEMPFATDERRCRAIARRKERPTWSDRAAIVIILIVPCCVSY